MSKINNADSVYGLIFANPMHYSNLDESDIALLPFMIWVAPLMRSEHERVIAKLHKYSHPYNKETLIRSINSAFAKPILKLCHKTMILELGLARHRDTLKGELPENRFRDFLNNLTSITGRKKFDASYPLLKAAVIQCIDQTGAALVSLLERLNNDQTSFHTLTEHSFGPGRLLGMETELGDRHHNGRSVTRLEFEYLTLYYKPRSLKIDEAYAHFIATMNEECGLLDQFAAKVLNCGEYGYAVAIKFQEAGTEQMLRDYYRRFGGLVAICYILAANDLHHENLIASGGYPVLIDVETLFNPKYFTQLQSKEALHSVGNTLFDTGALPFGVLGKATLDVSALYMPYQTVIQRVPVDLGTDSLCLKEQRIAIPFAKNMPRLNGRQVLPDRYQESIEMGFEATYMQLLSMRSKLLSEDGPLAPFKNLSSRVLLRETQVYGNVLRALAHPDYCKSESKRDALISRLKAKRDGWPPYKKCWSAERDALLRGDVPYFSATISSRDVQDDQGKSYSNLYGTSGWSVSRQRIRTLTRRDMRRQVRLLREAVICTKTSDNFESWSNLFPVHPVTDNHIRVDRLEFLEEATRIGDRLIECGFENGNYVRHFQLEFRDNKEMRPHQLGADLYGGLSGLAVFFAELYRQSRHARFLDAVEITLASARREYTRSSGSYDSIGAFSGVSGWIYALAMLGTRLKRPEWVDEAISWLPWLQERVQHDRVLDVVSGAAGALLVLSELERIAPERGAFKVAAACADHLAEQAKQQYNQVFWISSTKSDEILTGFAHGAAGIAAALIRFAGISNDERYLALANGAIHYEREHFFTQGWMNLRFDWSKEISADNCSHAWCHGAPGIGLSRMSLPKKSHDMAWKNELGYLLEHTRNFGFGGSHSLCHGQLGNLEFLMKHNEAYPDSPAAQSWPNIAAEILMEGRQGWRYCNLKGPEILGLMTGMAGIGYGLLRIVDPANVPSVLLLELGQ